MGCACNNRKADGTKKTFVVILPNGTRKSYQTEVEAKASAIRNGGTYREA